MAQGHPSYLCGAALPHLGSLIMGDLDLGEVGKEVQGLGLFILHSAALVQPLGQVTFLLCASLNQQARIHSLWGLDYPGSLRLWKEARNRGVPSSLLLASMRSGFQGGGTGGVLRGSGGVSP